MTWSAVTSQHTIPWWQLSGVTDADEGFLGIDFRLQLFNEAPLLVSAETARALRTFTSQITVP